MRRIHAAVVVIATAACAGQPAATGFYFLPPLVQQQRRDERFDPVPDPRVEICRLAEDACRDVVTTFHTSAAEGARLLVDTAAGHFAANWHTRDYELDRNATYRIRVVAAGTELGHIDVTIVSHAGRKPDNGSITLVQGRTLPIRFRTTPTRSSARLPGNVH